jgi:hypothetical protein
MVGGLVMGALEKLYRQPSLFACSLLKACEVAVSPMQKGHKKKAQSYPRYRRHGPTALSVHDTLGFS